MKSKTLAEYLHDWIMEEYLENGYYKLSPSELQEAIDAYRSIYEE